MAMWFFVFHYTIASETPSSCYSQVKGHTASKSVSFKLAIVEALNPAALQLVTSPNWSDIVGVEERM